MTNTMTNTITLIGTDGETATFQNTDFKGLHNGFYHFAEKKGEGVGLGGIKVSSWENIVVKADDVASILFGDDAEDAAMELAMTQEDALV